MTRFCRLVASLSMALTLGLAGRVDAKSLGHPEQDLIIKSIRDTFASDGRIPSEKEITEFPMICDHYSAKLDDFTVTRDNASVRPWYKVHSNLYFYQLPPNHYFKYFSFDHVGFSGSDDQSYFEGRIVRQTGAVIIEFSKFYEKNQSKLYPDSLAIPGLLAEAYVVCSRS